MTLPVLLSASAVGRGFRASRCWGGAAISLALAFRHDPVARDIPLVAMSASDSALKLADRTGDFNASIAKPFENDELVALVGRLTNKVAS